MKHSTPEPSSESDHTRVIERPDGFYWLDTDTGEEYGPFATLLVGSLVVLLLAEQRRGWSLMTFCARATRGRGLPSLDARSGRSISPHP